AEDGIRDYKVTGVQTCALPISDLATTLASMFSRRAERSTTSSGNRSGDVYRESSPSGGTTTVPQSVPSPNLTDRIAGTITPSFRSEERRVGKECRVRVARGQ